MSSFTNSFEANSIESNQVPFMGLFVVAALMLGLIMYAVPFFLHTFVSFQGDLPNQITINSYPI